MKRIFLAILILLSATFVFAQEADEPDVYCTIMFDFYGTPSEAEQVANEIMVRFGTQIIAQFKGQEAFIYCVAPGVCEIVGGKIAIVNPKSEEI